MADGSKTLDDLLSKLQDEINELTAKREQLKADNQAMREKLGILESRGAVRWLPYANMGD